MEQEALLPSTSPRLCGAEGTTQSIIEGARADRIRAGKSQDPSLTPNQEHGDSLTRSVLVEGFPQSAVSVSTGSVIVDLDFQSVCQPGWAGHFYRRKAGWVGLDLCLLGPDTLRTLLHRLDATSHLSLGPSMKWGLVYICLPP